DARLAARAQDRAERQQEQREQAKGHRTAVSVCIRLRPGATRTAGSLDEEPLQVQQRRPEDDDEHGREDEEDEREEHLDRRLHRLLLRRRLTAQARVGGLDAQDAPERDAELVGLDDRAREGRDLWRVEALGHLLERLLAAL